MEHEHDPAREHNHARVDITLSFWYEKNVQVSVRVDLLSPTSLPSPPPSPLPPSLPPYLACIPPRVKDMDEALHPHVRLNDFGGRDNDKGEVHGQLDGEKSFDHRPPQLRGLRVQLLFGLPLDLWARKEGGKEGGRKEGKRD